VTTSSGPYVGLDYFLEEDSELFFGRDDERKRIIGNLRASRLTLLHAESGVGKSSLLRAGVSARLRGLAEREPVREGAARYVPVVFSAWQSDATAGLIAALEAAVKPMAGELSVRRDALEHALEDVASAVDATPLLILDQFEEHFLHEPRAGNGFDDDLARCITRPDLHANFLISLREDAYSLLGQRFKATIPNVYGNYLHLDFLGERAARDAVLEPVRAFNERLPDGATRFEVDPELADAVLEQVRRGRVTIGDTGAPDVRGSGPVRIETAYLQLVMKRLWDEEVGEGSTRLRLETLRRLGGADTIVRSHLDDVMTALPAQQRDAAAAAFRFLVTSGGRKIALSTAELGEFSETPEAPLDAALGHLESQRILRRIPSPDRDGVPRREIYHDVLAPAILDWRRRHVDERRRAETERGLAEARERARRLEVRSRRLVAAVISLAAVLVGLALYLLDPAPARRLELNTIDARFAVRGTSDPDPRLVVIAVDDRTLARLAEPGDPRLPRQDYARMIRALHGAGARLIALDVLFPAPWTDRGDRALLRAFRATRDRLVIPFDEFVAVPSDEGQRVRADLLADPERVGRTGATTGYAGLPQDIDGSHRRTDLVVDFVNEKPAEGDPQDSVRAQTFAFAAADLVRGGALAPRADEISTAEGREEGAQSDVTSWIDYRGPSRTVPRVSALDVLDGRRDIETFRDKLVVIGVIARGVDDAHRTPVDRGDVPMPGAELQANAIDTLLRPSPLRDAPNPLDAIAMVLLACIPPLAALRRSRHFPAIAIAAAAGLYVMWAQLAFLSGWIVAVVVPLAALLAATAGVAGVAAGRAIRRRRADASDAASAP
jgi:CHASE2 domain-containing sensor protein